MINILLDKAYVSPYDKFLHKFEATHKKTKSQICEIEKNQRIAYLRDNAFDSFDKEKIWQDF